MLNRLRIRNFKSFEDVDIDLDDRVVLIGPNNSGKTAALQALALWDIGLRRWAEKRGLGEVSMKRPGVTINRRDLIAVPVPEMNLLWRGRRTRSGRHVDGKTRPKNILIEIVVDGFSRNGERWSCGFEFDHANPEAFYCRPLSMGDRRMPVPEQALEAKIAYLPPMSGLIANETRIDQGAIDVRIGEGRTAEILRNLCHGIANDQGSEEAWEELADGIEELFGSRLDRPRYIVERGELRMTYRTLEGTSLDISASGRGQQQTLLLLAYMMANPGAALLLDEPDAHLEILRQRQIYRLLGDKAQKHGNQIIAASHSEVVLSQAVERGDALVAFVGKPHRVNKKGQVLKALKDIDFHHYMLAEQTGWVLYLEGSTDLDILQAFARKLDHPAQESLKNPFVRYVSNHPKDAQSHYQGLREAKSDLVAIAIYDRLDTDLQPSDDFEQMMWRKREIENYLCQRKTLLSFSQEEGRSYIGDIATSAWSQQMENSISKIEGSLETLGKGSPWGEDIKAGDDFLIPLFRQFYSAIDVYNSMAKKDFHRLVEWMDLDDIDSEITEKLDAIHRIAKQARPGGG
ncbi:ATP-dependent nuclease [Thioalkalivibrio sp. HK1]|uniref:ATP-dependent nuclease n=1 Tax=Thioalkalivibrio sp. HK1 TaxID=1469245 RepID=UPI00046EB38F|nr:AAA family ATPase [Thioalkalivibrio sp. HK1]